MLVDGVTVEYRRKDGSIAGAQARVIDFDDADNNDWLAVNQFTVAEGQNYPPAGRGAVRQRAPARRHRTEKRRRRERRHLGGVPASCKPIRRKFRRCSTTNAVLVASDGIAGARRSARCRQGMVQALAHHCRTATTRRGLSELQVVLEGVFEKRRFLDLVRHFIVFEDEGAGKLTKKMAGLSSIPRCQCRLGRNAARGNPVAELAQVPGLSAEKEQGRYDAGPMAGGADGDRRVGVVWHTQGSGKSLTMAFYAGPGDPRTRQMENPTIVVLTDRNDLDDQLFGTFARCHDLLRQPPVQAADRADLRAKLVRRLRRRRVHDDPEISARRERRPASGALGPPQHRRDRRRSAPQPIRFHRRLCAAHARCAAARFVHRLHRHADRENRRQYARGVRRLHQRLRYSACRRRRRDRPDLLRKPLGEARVQSVARRPKIDPKFEEATEGEEIERKEKLKSKWAQLEVVVGTESRIKLIAKDLVEHFEERLAAMDGKAMVVYDEPPHRGRALQ